MAPKKMPKPETSGSIKSVLDQSYADAMENLMTGMKKAAAQGLFAPTDVERNFGLYKRAVRMLMAQGDNFIVKYFNETDPETLTDPEIAKKFATKVANKLGEFDAQKAMNFAPGIIEGHHGVSVDSIHAAAKHLPMKDRLEFIRVLNNEYGVGGTVATDMYPLSRFAHQGKGTGSVVQKASAHTTANPLELAQSKGFPVNTGTWSREFDFSSIKDPRKLAVAFMEQSGGPQQMMADKAFDSPQEVAIRKELADLLGVRERELYSISKDFKARGKSLQERFKAKGVTQDVINEIVHRNYGLEYTPRKGKLPSGPRIPKPKVTPTAADAEQFAKGWFDEADFPTTTPGVEYGMRFPIPNPKDVVNAARQNPLGVAGGTAMTLLNDEVAQSLAKDDYKTAAMAAAKDVAIGAGTEAILKQGVAPLAQRVAPAAAARVAPYVAGAARVGIPAAVGTGLFMQGKTGSALDTLTKKASTVVPGLKSDPQTDIGRRLGKAISNELEYFIFKPIGSAFSSVFGKREI